MTSVLVIDNYDSFVYTLNGYLLELGAETRVVRNDAFSEAEALEEMAKHDAVLISPGPGTPAEAGVSVAAVREATTAGDEDAVTAACVNAVEPLLEQADSVWTRARDLVRLAETDDTVTTTAALAVRAGCSERTLQRLFARYVGPSPKQVVLRYRLQNAVAALDADTAEPLADLAARLGFYDQAHLAREFTAFVGIAPGAYRAGRAWREAN